MRKGSCKAIHMQDPESGQSSATVRGTWKHPRSLDVRCTRYDIIRSVRDTANPWGSCTATNISTFQVLDLMDLSDVL
ncbi:hypothetical protein M8818_005091 [Zalaria obscura]|uniref:Uncharacterized protein n=1 Tax=Zalaria obscura TaxID=2024903 RepID=A0ACC3SAA4_9PEZI